MDFVAVPTVIRIELLRSLLQHLLNNPGEFEWHWYCSIQGMDILTCAIHREWLVKHEFTVIKEGRTYRTAKPISDVPEALGLMTPKRSSSNRSLGSIGRYREPPKIEIKYLKPAIKPKPEPKPKTPRKPKPKTPRKPKPEPKPKTPRKRAINCTYCLKNIEFRDLSICEIAQYIESQFRASYPISRIDRILRTMAGRTVVITRLKQGSAIRYTKSNTLTSIGNEDK
jgi:hypothetical protein